jgi:hypothetical protein
MMTPTHCNYSIVSDRARQDIIREKMRRLGTQMIVRGMIVGALLLTGCSLFRPPEEVREQSGRTTYRVPGGSVAEMPSPTPVPLKVPGESKKN